MIKVPIAFSTFPIIANSWRNHAMMEDRKDPEEKDNSEEGKQQQEGDCQKISEGDRACDR